jgi:RNA polymerase sigma-70 factor, ECF subfamily
LFSHWLERLAGEPVTRERAIACGCDQSSERPTAPSFQSTVSFDSYPAFDTRLYLAAELRLSMALNWKEAGRLARRRAIARDEYAFLAAAKRGDSAPFETLCKQSEEMGFRVARRMLRSDEDAEDVTQESFQRAFVHLKSFKGDSRFSTWLSRIAINSALMKLRKNHHLWDVSLGGSAESEQPSARLDVEDQGMNPEELYVQQERQRILGKAMNDLTPGMRKAIELRELDEQSIRETA